MKHIKLLFITLLFPAFSHAQIGLSAVSPIDIDLGLKAGANFAKLDGNTWNNGYKAGFLGGIYGSIHTKKIGVQIEGLFSQANYTTTGTEFYRVYKGLPGFFRNVADSAKQGDISVSYFSIPVLLHFKLFSNAWVQLGPQYSGIISVNDKDDLLNDARGLFGNGDFSGVIGVWLNLPVGLNAGARYIIGFNDQNKIGLSEAWKNRTIQLHIGYNIF
jgi:hypothetical protein